MGTVVVTGGAGFIGSHLCRRLVREGRHVSCIDDLSTGTEANVADLLWGDRFVLLRRDVVGLVWGDCDEIYNLACPASPKHYQSYPIRTIKTAVLGTLNALDIAMRSGAVMLQASTSEVYGDPEEHPQTEVYRGNVDPLSERACYDEGKRCAETLCADFRRVYGVDSRIARIFNTYGPGMSIDDGRVVSNFVVQALQGKPLTVYGDGRQTRSFCYVDDTVDGLVKFMESTGGAAGPINIGNPEEVTILELVERIVSATGSRSSLRFYQLPAADPAMRCPDVSRAEDYLGWSPKVPLDEGLRRTVEYFDAELRRGSVPLK